MNDEPVGVAYRIEDLAHHSGATVRTIRAYQDRGLLPRPERRGRANVYADAHLARLRQIADLLDRGYTLASIKELLEAWDAGRGLGGILGLVAEVDGPWTDEEAVRMSRAELDERFGGSPDDAEVAEAVELGVLERVPGEDEVYLVPSPQELAVAAELYAAGVPLSAISGHLRELRGKVEHIASRFLEFTTEHVFARYLGEHPPSDAEATEAASSYAVCDRSPGRRWTRNWPAPCGCSRTGTCVITWGLGNPTALRTGHVPWSSPSPQRGLWRPWLAPGRWRPSSRRLRNGRSRQGPWTTSPQITTITILLTKHRKSLVSCPQIRQFTCG